MGATPTHLNKLGQVQATRCLMEQIGGFKAEPLAARRGAALAALSLKQVDGDCRQCLRDFAPILVGVEVPKTKIGRNRPGLLRPDYSEKNQSRRNSHFRNDC